jgi:hypothetical protein
MKEVAGKRLIWCAKLQSRRRKWWSYEVGVEKDDEKYEIVDKTYGHNSEVTGSKCRELIETIFKFRKPVNENKIK